MRLFWSRSLFALSLISLACSHEIPKAVIEISAPNPNFNLLVDRYFDSVYSFSPTWATSDGLHNHDLEIENLSRASFESRNKALKTFAGEFAALKIESLSFDEQIDRELLQNAIQAALYRYDTLKLWEKNPIIYASAPGEAIGVIVKRDFAPAKERLALVTSRLKGIPAIYQEARANLKNPSKELTQIALDVSQGSIDYFKAELASWAKLAAGDDKALLAAFTGQNKKAAQATEAFAMWLKKDLLPKAKGSFAIGKPAYEALLKYDEMVDLSLDQVLALGEANLKKDYDAFVTTANRIDPKKSPAQVMKLLYNEHPTAGDLIPSVKRTVEDARKFLVDHDIVTIPSEVRPTIEETPVYSRTGTYASMSTPGPFETKAHEAYYYVTPVEENWSAEHKEEHLSAFNPYIVALINVHEAYPGHYLQFIYSSQYPTKTRKLLSASTNSEGWAHYTEQMMVDQGFGDGNPKIRLAQLEEALLRDCRYVVGIKMHTEGWTVEQGAKFFEQYGFQIPAVALAEAGRGAYDPTYLYYTLGKIEVQKLRDDYMRETGKSLKDFHNAFVTQGALPIPIIRRILLPKK